MSEVKKEMNENELTQEENEKISKLTLGADYSAKVTIKDHYVFHVCIPTFLQDLQISINANNILADMIKEDDGLKTVAVIIATLRMAVVKIEEKQKENGIEREKLIDEGQDCLWRFIGGRRDVDAVYSEIIGPLYNEYLIFKSTVNTSVDELKNS